MLKKINRLKTKEFSEVFKNGKKLFSDNFIFIEKKSLGDKKISVAISKKLEKKAVRRTASKRIIYRLLRESLLLVPNNLMVIVLIIKPILDKDKKEIEKEIFSLFKKIEN